MWRAGTIAVLAMVSMGSASDSAHHRDSTALAMVPVSINGHGLEVSRFEVTVGQWNECVRAHGCEDIAPKVSRPDITPMTGVNWFDVQGFLVWYNASHAGHMRLPTAAEWTGFSNQMQAPIVPALFTDPRLAWAASYGQEATPAGPVRVQGSWPQTRDGVADLSGNVWEWTSTCIMATDSAHCPAMQAMGAHVAAVSVFVRNPSAGGCATGKPPTHLGFRLVSTSASTE